MNKKNLMGRRARLPGFLVFCGVMGLVMPAIGGANDALNKRIVGEYEKQFIAFNARINQHLAVVRECMVEMDRFEAGDYARPAAACQRYNEMRLRDAGLVAEAESELRTYGGWVDHVGLPDHENSAQGQRNVTALLLRIYEIELEAATRQTLRLQAFQSQDYGEVPFQVTR